VPAAKEPLDDGLYSSFHYLLHWQFVLHFRARSCMRTLALWAKENSSAVEQKMRDRARLAIWTQKCRTLLSRLFP
jgi:hypothetical protein